MRILVWHVHGSWATAFLQGGHEYLLPVVPDRSADGLGRATSWDWPASAREVTPEELRTADVDVMVLQRPRELELAQEWTGRRPGRDVPALYVEHNTPGGAVPFTPHPLADQSDIPVVHVTHFNRLFWDCGSAPTYVVDHGVVDPGHRYSGELERGVVVVNEPCRRGRAVGTDLLADIARAAPLDVYGMKVDELARWPGLPRDRVATVEGVRQDALHAEMARRRVYVHLTRWTSLGLSLIEAMHLGMPVVALATTEVPSAVPAEAGVVSTDIDVLVDAVRRFIADPDAARAAGDCARREALRRFGLGRFLADWDALLAATVPVPA